MFSPIRSVYTSYNMFEQADHTYIGIAVVVTRRFTYI